MKASCPLILFGLFGSAISKDITPMECSSNSTDYEDCVMLDWSYSRNRQWEYISSPNGNDQSKMGLELKLLSYNILAQDLLEEHSHIYTNHQQNILNWEIRLKNIKKEISTIRPNILCLQEVQEDHLIDIIKNLAHLNYSYIYKKKTGFRTDGCAILFNKDIFQLAFKRTVEYFQPNFQHLDRDNVALIAKLRVKKHPNETFLVATTHLLYNPKRADVRLAQVQLLLAELDRYSIKTNPKSNEEKPQRIPIILTGDFNLQPNSSTYRLITEGKLSYENMSKTSLEYNDPNNANQSKIGKTFLNPQLGITNNCQHEDLINNHYSGNTTRLYHSELNVTRNVNGNTFNSDVENLYATGTLTHELKLNSIHNHDKTAVCSTFQDEWITVDYIFYSKNDIAEENGSLKLLGKYSLPTVEECNIMGKVPNSVLGSDHLSLGAKFFLSFSTAFIS